MHADQIWGIPEGRMAFNLEILKRQHFVPETREARIAKALAALKAGPTLRLSDAEWEDAAENPDFEESE